VDVNQVFDDLEVRDVMRDQVNLVDVGGGRDREVHRAPARLAATGPLRSTELIYCWDPDGPSDPRGFARADHCDHIHWGMDA
jgi:hypothetical protein